jgi:CDP-glucose 4,6-dehydratase
MVNRDFWKNKRVLVTGHAGFKGSWLCLWLADMQANVLGFGQTTPSLQAIFPNHEKFSNFKRVDGDIRNLDQLKTAFSEFQPDIVIHLAAQSLVLSSYENPVDTYSTNVMGTLNVLETIRYTHSVKAGLVISSDKCYENKNSLWGMRETDPMGGNDPYSSSKACVEILTHSYRQSYFSNQDERSVAIASARAGNVLGGGDWSQNRLIPDCIRSWRKQEEVIIRSPKATRPWQHVLDVLDGYLLLVQRMVENPHAFAEPWNFGPLPHEDKSVQWIVKALSGFWGQGAAWRIDANPTYHEAPTLTVDSTKSRKLLGWKPRLSLHDSLHWTVEWYKQSFEETANMQDFSEQQIYHFQNM